MSSLYALRLKSLTNYLSKNSVLSTESVVSTDCMAGNTSSVCISPTCATVTHHICPQKYVLLSVIGAGTYGQVFKAQHLNTGRVVAIKKIVTRIKSEYIQNEINLLTQIKHKNIVQLIDRFDSSSVTSTDNSSGHQISRTTSATTRSSVIQYLVFEFCDFDLRQLLYELPIHLSFANIKNILQQILKGIAYIHDRQVLHRDLKPENILMNAAGKVRIADFGFAKSLKCISWSGFSPNVVTLAYRAPELLVGYRFYGTGVDMWSIGCLMAEFWTRNGPLLDGHDEYEQLIIISQLCGPINSVSLLGVHNMYFMSDLYLPQIHRRKVRQTFAIKCTDESRVVDLFDQLLCLNLEHRMSASDALKHPLFTTTDPTLEDKACDISLTLRSLLFTRSNRQYNRRTDTTLINTIQISNNKINTNCNQNNINNKCNKS